MLDSASALVAEALRHLPPEFGDPAASAFLSRAGDVLPNAVVFAALECPLAGDRRRVDVWWRATQGLCQRAIRSAPAPRGASSAAGWTAVGDLLSAWSSPDDMLYREVGEVWIEADCDLDDPSAGAVLAYVSPGPLGRALP